MSSPDKGSTAVTPPGAGTLLPHRPPARRPPVVAESGRRPIVPRRPAPTRRRPTVAAGRQRHVAGAAPHLCLVRPGEPLPRLRPPGARRIAVIRAVTAVVLGLVVLTSVLLGALLGNKSAASPGSARAAAASGAQLRAAPVTGAGPGRLVPPRVRIVHP